MKIKLSNLILIGFTAVTIISLISCNNNPITQLFNNSITAKQRLDSAYAKATRDYGPNTKLELIFGRNVKADGTTDISTFTAITSPDSIGTWLYIFRTAGDSSNLKVYTPSPIPGSSDCIELTSFFNINTVLNLIVDTSTRDIISGALNLITSVNVSITTPTGALLDSDSSLYLANNTSPIIRFDASWTPSSSIRNGNYFLSTGTNQSRNMFLIPAVGTLHLPTFIQELTGFPNDLWIVNYRKTDSLGVTQSLALGTVVQSNQIMVVPSVVSSRVINLSTSSY